MGLTILVARDEESPEDWQIRRPPSSPKTRGTSSEAILLLVTSATTAKSKVVPLTAANLDAGSVAKRDSLQLTASDRMLLMTSLSHSIGIGTTLAQFLVGGSVIATGGFDSTDYLRWLNDLRPTWYDCAPTVHQAALVQLMRTPPQMPVSLRFIQSAGAPLPVHTRQGLEQLLQIPVFNDYGMTEACAIATDAFLPDGRVPNSAGRSCGMQIGITDNSGTVSSARRRRGDCGARPGGLFRILDDPEASRAAFQNDWFKTGDPGHLDQEGNLFVTGRLKEMINRGGEKIVPSEVDELSLLILRWLRSQRLPCRIPTLGEDVACAVVLREESEARVSTHELRRHAAQRLAPFKVPHHIYFVDADPRGELGKPQRWLLSERLSVKQPLHRRQPK